MSAALPPPGQDWPCPRCGDVGYKQPVTTTTTAVVGRSRHTGAAIVLCLLFPPLLLVWAIVAIVRLFAGRQPVPVTTARPSGQFECRRCGIRLTRN